MSFFTLTLEQLLELQAETIRCHGGATGVRDLGLIESALAQPAASFGGTDLYPTLIEKASALAFSLAKNHGFIDGNKRIAFATLDAFLRVNGYEIIATVDDAEQIVLGVAASRITREAFTEWVGMNTVPLTTDH
jgi:death-on-curing protein